MKMIPSHAEVAWLLGKKQAKSFSFVGGAEFGLSGNGTTGDYNLSGDWNLTKAAYSFKNYINKPAERANRLSFKGNLNKQEAKLSQLTYDLSPLHLDMSAAYRYEGSSPLSITIKTNQVPAGELTHMLPAVKQYRPAGKLQASLHGTGSDKDFSKFNWGGDIYFSSFSIKPPEPVKTVSNMSATIHFSGEELETSQLTAKIGNSAISAKGSIKGFKNPTLNLSFSSPSLNMSDLGLSAPGNVFRRKN